jgi:hypothetical protein
MESRPSSVSSDGDAPKPHDNLVYTERRLTNNIDPRKSCPARTFPLFAGVAELAGVER